jgi:uncharacterized protein (DUF427 family)
MSSASSGRPVKQPGPDHPITIAAAEGRVTVTLGGKLLADSRAALTLREASYPPVHYIPRGDVDMAQLTRSSHATYCPYKGEAAYFSLPAAGGPGENAVWSYEAPYPAVAAIKDHLAFYPDRVDAIAVTPGG